MARTGYTDTELFSVFSKHSDSVRRSMFSSSHAYQSIPVINADTNKVNSIYSQIWASGDIFRLAENKTKILKKYKLMEHTFILVKDIENNVIDLHFVDNNNNGFKYEDVDITEDKIVEEGEIIYEQGSHNKLFSIGKRARVAITAHGELFEDTIAISQTFADNLKHIESKTFNLKVTMETEFVNTFGDKDNFIPIPDVADGNVLNMRKRTDINFLSFTRERLDKKNIFRDYKDFDGEGTTFLDVYIHPSMKIPKTLTWSYLKDKADKTTSRMEEFIKDINTYIKDGSKISKITFNIYNYYANLIKGVKKYNKVEFKDSAIVKLTVDTKVDFSDGSKLVNLFGTKGLTKIVPDSKMLTDVEGKPVDILIDTTTIIGRMNLSQIREMEFNKIIDDREKLIKNTSEVEDKIDLLEDFLKNDCVMKLKFKRDDLKDIVLDTNFTLIGIVDDIPNHVYEKNKVDLYKQMYIDGKPLKNKVLVGTNYILKLKHVASKKSSGVSLPYENDAGKPIRSNKKELLKFSTQPSSLGSMEISHLRMVGKDILEELVNYRSRNKPNRIELAKMLMSNNKIKIDDITVSKQVSDNPSLQLFNETLKSMGIKI